MKPDFASTRPLREELTIISPEQARAAIMAGKKLQGIRVEFLDLAGIEIPHNLCIEGSQIGGLDLRGSVIKGDCSFSGTTFLGPLLGGTKNVFDKSAPLLCQGCIACNTTLFQEEVYLGGATFEQAASFKDAEFLKDAVFYGVTFKEQLYLWATRFHQAVVFNHARCEGEAHFSHIKIEKKAKFEGVYFGAEATFEKGQLNSSGSFYGAQFKGPAIFKQIELSDMRFEEVAFTQEADFSKSIFHGEADFKKAVFQKTVSFKDAVFNKKASFRQAQFQDEVEFVYVRFYGLASYLETDFQARVTFLNSQFHDEALFNFDRNSQQSLGAAPSAAHFAGPVDFTNVRFQRRTVFENIDFADQVLFPNAYFGEQAAFHGVRCAARACFDEIYCNQEMDLNTAHFQAGCSFDHANINRRLNLTGAHFPHITFYGASIDNLMVERAQVENRLHNEIKTSPAYYRAEKEYLLLKESFAKRGLQDEEDWAYRKKKAMGRKARSLIAWAALKGQKETLPEQYRMGKVRAMGVLLKNALSYLFLDKGSGYGTQPLRITILALAMILMFAALYALYPEQLIRPDGPDGITFSARQAIYFSFATFTTMGFGDIQPHPYSYMKYVVSLEAFLGIFVMTLFVGTYTRKIIR